MRATVAIASPSTIGCQPYRARTPHTTPKAMPTPIGSDRAARYQPGALSLAASVTAGYLRAGLARKSAFYLRGSLRLDEWLGGEPAGGLELALPGGPGVELRAWHHVGAAPHGRVAEAAELRADDVVAAQPVRCHAPVSGDPGHRVRLQAKRGDPERVDHVLRGDVELDGLVLGQVEPVALQVPQARVLEVPGELLAVDLHGHLVRLLRLDVIQHDPRVDRQRRDDQERDRHPDHLEAGVAVDRRAVAHVAGACAVPDDAVDRHGHHQDEDRDRDEQQDVVQRVDLVGALGRPDREPVDEQHDRVADQRRDEPDQQHPRYGMLVLVVGAATRGRPHRRASLNEPQAGGSRGPRSAQPTDTSARPSPRAAHGGAPWCRRNVLANCAGCRYPTLEATSRTGILPS